MNMMNVMAAPRSVHEYVRELATRLKSAVNVRDGVIDFRECLNVAVEIERLPALLEPGIREQETTDFNPLMLGTLLGIKQISAARILACLLNHPDMVHSQESLSARFGFSSRSVVVYMSHLRSALEQFGMRHFVHAIYKSGYYVSAADVEVMRAFITSAQASAPESLHAIAN